VSWTFNIITRLVPEPSTGLLLSVGALTFLFRRRRHAVGHTASC
jgi:hypothetical protein